MSQHADEDLRRLFNDAAATIGTLSPEFTETVIARGHKRRRTKKRSLLAAVAAVLAIVIGAASQSPGLTNGSTPQPADNEDNFSPPSSRSELGAALLGRWEQTSTCQQRVNSLNAVGFGPLDAGLAIGVGPGSRRGHLALPGVVGPGVHHIVDFAHPCVGATPRTDHRIFAPPAGRKDYYRVTAPSESDGELPGSIASYRVVGPRTIALDTGSLPVTRSLRRPDMNHAERDGIIRFHVRMLSPNTMTLDPVVPSCITNRCFAAGWAVAVANPGQIWHRVS